MILLLLLALIGPVFGAEGFLEQQAELAWQDRENPGKTEEAIHIWEQAARAEPGRADLQIALSKALGRAVRHAGSSPERQKWADQARAAAEKATLDDPSSAAAFAAYGEALGQWADAHKGVHSLGVVRQAVDALQKAIALNPKYAYAHMLLAEFYRQSPRVLSVGNKEKALEQARLAVQFGPGYAINHLVLARALLDVGKKEEGAAELQKISALPPPADAIPETRSDQRTAESMLKSMGFAPASKIDASPAGETPHCGEAAGTCSEQP
jgi:tetratricopeptide (TPR) repeat protein